MEYESDYLYYVNQILALTNKSINNISTKNLYVVNGFIVKLWYNQNKEYLDGLQYKTKNDILWTYSTPKEFYDNFCNNDKKLKFILYSFRKYGEPKLEKPKELKGIKQSFSIDYIPKKCRCPIFINGNDIWVQHNDYFSPTMEIEKEDIGMPLSYKVKKYCSKSKSEKFIYPDSWGSIVLRQQAWIKIENLIYRIKLGEFELDLLKLIRIQQEQLHSFKENELVDSDMERFFEKIISECKKIL